jgi:hypothetical protein
MLCYIAFSSSFPPESRGDLALGGDRKREYMVMHEFKNMRKRETLGLEG